MIIKMADDVYLKISKNTDTQSIGPEVYIYLQEEDGTMIQDLAVIRNTDKQKTNNYPRKYKDAVEILIWSDENNEDYTHKFEINTRDTGKKIRKDFDTALSNIERGWELSEKLSWGFSREDIANLAKLHKEGKHKQKIEELLEDCNFHKENSDFVNNNYEPYLHKTTY